ncbi:MAG: hypothetical protein RIQ60_3507 [Pseudomonadota bacterium]|jgi:hypothetical protein
MKVLDLQCAQGHGFEGWFGSDDDYQQQTARGLLECPLCADKSVRRLPSAPRLNLVTARQGSPAGRAAAARQADGAAVAQVAAARAEAPSSGRAVTAAAAPAGTPEQQSVEALWMQAVRHVMANTQDVGQRFAEEARRMHYGETELRGIRGQTTPEEARALDEEGIEVYSLPVPAVLKGPAH